MPKHRVPSSEKDAPCRRSPPSPSRSSPAWSARPQCADDRRRPHRRGLRGRSASDPGRRAPPGDRRGGLGLALSRQSAVTVCQQGRKLSEGAAAWIRHAGGTAETLAGGFEAWAKAGLPLVPEAKLPPRDRQGRTVWVTRARPKIDRIACPWLIRRFVDPERRVPVRGTRRGRGRGRPVRRDAVRCRERVLEPSRRATAPST